MNFLSYFLLFSLAEYIISLSEPGGEVMATNEVRIPKQKRSIEKKDAIIRASYTLFCEKGYYKTNTAEIAKMAGVSTGIVYSYFQDKKDILVEVVKLYISILGKQFQPILTSIDQEKDFVLVINEFIDTAISSHQMNQEAHNEFLALALLNADIQNLFDEFEEELLNILHKKMMKPSLATDELLLEKLRISYGIIENLCHDYISSKIHKSELEQMKAICISLIVKLLQNP